MGWKAVQKGKEVEAEKKEDSDEQILSSLPTLTEGEILSLVNAEITEHKTKPKPLYTEATLLSAMENAGKEVEDAESKKAMAACGIGTPATRANIFETLILRDYIRRDKKAIIPTEKGLAVYDIVKDKKIANAEMTGSWNLPLPLLKQERCHLISSHKASTHTWGLFARNSFHFLQSRSPILSTAAQSADSRVSASMPR